MASPETKDIGRNDPCHCGSQKKYKKCHLAKDEEKARKEAEKIAKAAPVPSSDAPKDTKKSPMPVSHKQETGFKKFFERIGFRKATHPRRIGGS